jgi:hypothetical protein
VEAALAENVPTFEPPDVSVPATLRMPRSTSDGLEALAKLWQLLARARGESESTIKQIDKSHVMRRLLRFGVVQSFAELGLDFEKVLSGEVEWSTVEKVVAASGVKQSKR